MGKYTSFTPQRPLKSKSDGPHEIWRGIGCLMMIIVPVISFAFGVTLIKYGITHGWSIPYQLLGLPTLPDFVFRSSGLVAIVSPIARIENLYAYLTAGGIIMILLSGLISMLYAFVYRFFGPPRWGPLDEPPPRIKTKRYTR